MGNPLDLFPVLVRIPVAWGDMDAFQHVNNVMYFRYFETSRIAYFERLGYMELMAKTGLGPILASTQCRYKIPLTYPDTIIVGARVSEMKEDRFTMNHLVFSGRFQKTAAEGDGLIVSFDYRVGEKVPLPLEIRQRINDLEASPLSRSERSFPEGNTL
jgi:acyl-CoA thioester hydrolase